MNMQQHILAGLREEYEQWQALLASLSPEQILTPLRPSEWNVKDNLVHLWAWQQRTLARCAAAVNHREPQFPNWPAELALDEPGGPHALNAWIYAAYRDQPWPAVLQNWQTGFLRLLQLAEQISERDLLSNDRYPWLKEYSLASILLATYDHHQEHLDELRAWLQAPAD